MNCIDICTNASARAVFVALSVLPTMAVYRLDFQDSRTIVSAVVFILSGQEEVALSSCR